MQGTETIASACSKDYYQQGDAVLLQQCLERNEQAWSALLQRYGNIIYSIAWRSNLSSEEVARVFQSVWLTLIQNLDLVHQEPRLTRWLVTRTLHESLRVGEERQGNYRCDTHPVLSEKEITELEQERLLWQALSSMAAPCQELLKRLLYDKHSWLCQHAAKPTPTTCGIEPNIRCCLAKLLATLKELGF